MKKRIIQISVIIAAAILLVLAARLLYTGFSRKGQIQAPVKIIAPLDTVEFSALKHVKDLLNSGKRAEAIKQLESIADTSKGQRDGYEAVLMLASVYQSDRNLLKAKELYHEIINEYYQFCDYAKMQKKTASVNMELLFSNIPTPHSEIYTVVPGDSLGRIASRYSTTVELIKRANGLRSDTIIPGMRLKLQNTPFHIIVDNKQCTLTVLHADEVIKTYNVATGKNNSTPIGSFTVKDKLVDPVWYHKGMAIPPESPENVLGTRWMGLTTPEPGYGIHGTTEPESIGYQSTDGCVRMHNEEVEELYSIIPIGTTVTIVD